MLTFIACFLFVIGIFLEAVVGLLLTLACMSKEYRQEIFKYYEESVIKFLDKYIFYVAMFILIIAIICFCIGLYLLQ